MTEPMTGYFSVRRFKDGVEFSKRPFATEADTIQFSTIFAGDVSEELKPYVREVEKGEEKVQRLNIKIASHCKWYDGNNLPMQKPLENGTYSPLKVRGVRYRRTAPSCTETRRRDRRLACGRTPSR